VRLDEIEMGCGTKDGTACAALALPSIGSSGSLFVEKVVEGMAH